MEISGGYVALLLLLLVLTGVALGIVSYYYRHKQCAPCGSSSIAEGTTLKAPSIAIQTPNWIFGMTAAGSLYTAKLQITENVQSVSVSSETSVQGTKALFDDRGELILYDTNNKVVWSSPSPLQTDLPVGDYSLTIDDATGNLNVLRSGVLVRIINLGVPKSASGASTSGSASGSGSGTSGGSSGAGSS